MEKYIELISASFIYNPAYKNPLDLIILQEIIFEKKPDIIIVECRTYYGGSAYFIVAKYYAR